MSVLKNQFAMIQADGRALAIFLPGNLSLDSTRFFTPNDEPFQFGIGVFKNGSKVEPHRHQGKITAISEFQEFILLRKGLVIARVFNEDGVLQEVIEMNPGDALLLLRGGHSFEFLKDSELLEIKQGPYQGREQMKVPFKPLLSKGPSLNKENVLRP